MISEQHLYKIHDKGGTMTRKKRKTNSKNAIRSALSRLLLEQSLESLTISQLTKEAGINRGTFYLHYVDKQDMFNQLKSELLGELGELFATSTVNRANFLASLQYIQDNYDFIYALMQMDYQEFHFLMKNFTLQLLDDTPHAKDHLVNKFQVPYKYAVEIFAATIEAVITKWLSTGAKEEPIEIATVILSVTDFTTWNHPITE